ncbi:MAG: hypothetical protein M5U28_36125 [Sandaracinaceae bacterium]|nr:hypothetical protein [Sandaracinaceae bacterium]
MTRSIMTLALLSLACDAPRAPLDAGSDAGAPVLADVQYALRCAEDGCARVDVDVYGTPPEVLATCARTESGLVNFAAAPSAGRSCASTPQTAPRAWSRSRSTARPTPDAAGRLARRTRLRV